MFIVFSKTTGNIKNIVTGSICNSLKDLYPYDYEDYEVIYDCINVDDDLIVINNQDMFKIKNNKITLKDDKLSKYKE